MTAIWKLFYIRELCLDNNVHSHDMPKSNFLSNYDSGLMSYPEFSNSVFEKLHTFPHIVSGNLPITRKSCSGKNITGISKQLIFIFSVLISQHCTPGRIQMVSWKSNHLTVITNTLILITNISSGKTLIKRYIKMIFCLLRQKVIFYLRITRNPQINTGK